MNYCIHVIAEVPSCTFSILFHLLLMVWLSNCSVCLQIMHNNEMLMKLTLLGTRLVLAKLQAA